MKKLVCGVGINDADYPTSLYENLGYDASGKRLKKCIWFCPYYQRWVNMLKRCYSPDYQVKFPSYIDCSVTPEWHYFMTFRSWMETQDWEGKELDKDLLVKGNKIYSAETCLFLDKKVNYFLTEKQSKIGDLPIGVSFHKSSGKLVAQGNDVQTGTRVCLGYFACQEKAHNAWLSHKQVQAKILASEQKDERVAEALIKRYSNYD